MDETIFVRRGGSALILSQPHTGTLIPDDIAGHLVSEDLARKDTDWWIDRLYQPLADALDATIVRTPWSRTVIDVNRDPSGVSLYPGQATTGLCPVETFDGEPLYRPGELPDDDEIARRQEIYFAPYHAALEQEIERVKAQHGFVALHDCHSIRSRVERLFEGELPDLNLGTNDGASIDPALQAGAVLAVAGMPFTHVVNGRFKGGWITRHHGNPENGVQALQMEIAQQAYMNEDRVEWDEAIADRLRPVLLAVLNSALDHKSTKQV